MSGGVTKVRVKYDPDNGKHPWRAQFPCCAFMHKADGWSGGWPTHKGVLSWVADHQRRHAESD